MRTDAVAVTTTCPACNRGLGSQQSEVYQFAQAYLCGNHAFVWQVADERAHRGGCPHAPKRCTSQFCTKEVA